jgi:hypothetical protein
MEMRYFSAASCRSDQIDFVGKSLCIAVDWTSSSNCLGVATAVVANLGAKGNVNV